MRGDLRRTFTPLIAAAVAVVFVLDLSAPLGFAVWVVYCIPIVLCLVVSRPATPLIVALASTAATTAGYFLSPPGMYADIVRVNRGVGLATFWIMAIVARQFILNRLFVQRQTWIQSGQTGLSRKMSGDQTLPELAGSILRFLAEYLDAQSGVFFVEESGAFKRAAAYAVPADSTVPQKVQLGEGLLGQAAKDARTFVLRGVPPEHFPVASALGKSLPRELLISSVSESGSVNAVYELAFSHPVFSSDEELLQRVGESIGVAVRSSEYRTKLNELLLETQRQAEELQAQSEELRVNNEELEEQTRALKESQKRLELQQSELEQTNVQLEEQAELLEEQKAELVRARDAVAAQAREIETVSRYKSDFLASMSHELRTPLNSLLILAQLLAENREGNLTAEQVHYAETIKASGNDLLLLISDVLDLSKIEAGRMEVRREEVQVEGLLHKLRANFEPQAARKNLSFSVRAAADSPRTVETDQQRVEQVLRNLLSSSGCCPPAAVESPPQGGRGRPGACCRRQPDHIGRGRRCGLCRGAL